ncbi:MAG TPA: phospholipase D-like domain-containing protein, partial [Kofleriaceae bacterium]
MKLFVAMILALSACIGSQDAFEEGDDAELVVTQPDVDTSGVSPEEQEPDDPEVDSVTAAVAGHGSVTAVDGDGWRIEFIANDPEPGSSDSTIEDQYARLVAAVPQGSEIRAGFYDMGSSATSKPYTSLRDANARGVTVRLLHDGQANAAGTNAKRLASALGGDDFHWCDHASNIACISTKANAIMHAKYSLLSRTRDTAGREWTYATWIGSANFSATSGKKSQNNALVIYGDHALYTEMRDHWFTTQWHDAGPASDIASGVTGDACVTVYGNPYTNTTTDVWALHLSPFTKAT